MLNFNIRHNKINGMRNEDMRNEDVRIVCVLIVYCIVDVLHKHKCCLFICVGPAKNWAEQY